MNSAHRLALLVVLAIAISFARAEEPTPTATNAYNNYLTHLEARLSVQHRAPQNYLAKEESSRLRAGNLLIEQVNSRADESRADEDLPGAMLHHWRGTAFISGAHAADFERLLRNYPAYPQVYAPQVLTARTLAQQGDHMKASMRVRQKHVITVVLDTDYDVAFAHLDPAHGASIAHGTRVTEIADAGTAKEHRLSPRDQQGFLWRIDTYWSWAEQDGGLYIQIESVTQTRGIPHGLGWIVSPFVQSIPRESLEFTLRQTVQALARRN